MDKQFPDWIIFALLQALYKNTNLEDQCETDCTFYFCVVTVDEEYGGRGLAEKLNQLAIDLAFQTGAGAIAVRCGGYQIYCCSGVD